MSSTWKGSSGAERFGGILLALHGVISGAATWQLAGRWTSGLGRALLSLLGAVPILGTTLGTWGIVATVERGERAGIIVILWSMAAGVIVLRTVSDAGGLTELASRRGKRPPRISGSAPPARSGGRPLPGLAGDSGSAVSQRPRQVASHQTLTAYVEDAIREESHADAPAMTARIGQRLHGQGLIIDPRTDLATLIAAKMAEVQGSVDEENAGDGSAQGSGPTEDSAGAPPTISDAEIAALTAAVAAELPEASAADLMVEIVGILGDRGEATDILATIRTAAHQHAEQARRPGPEPAAPGPVEDGRRVERGPRDRAQPRTDLAEVTTDLLPLTPLCYRIGSLWATRIAIDSTMLAESSTGIPAAFARHLEVDLLGAKRFATTRGPDVLVDRRGGSDRITGLLPLADHLSLAPGDHLLLIAPAGAGLPLRTRSVLQRDLVALRPAEQAALLLGLTGRSGPDALPRAVGLHPDATLQDVIARLRARGETGLAQMLEADADPAIGTTSTRPTTTAPQPRPRRREAVGDRTQRTRKESVPQDPTRRPRESGPPSDPGPEKSAPGISDIADILGL